MVEFYSKATLPTLYGDFEIYVFKDYGLEHVALLRHYDDLPVLVRIHSKCLTGDVLGSLRCDCGFQLERTLSSIGQVGGLLIYLDQEGRGIGLADKIKAYTLQEKGYDTVDANILLGFNADERSFAPAASILEYFKVKTVALLTNNPQKIEALKSRGFEVYRIQIPSHPNPHNIKYLKTKEERMGHDFSGDCDIIRRYREIVRKFNKSNKKRKKPSRPRLQIR